MNGGGSAGANEGGGPPLRSLQQWFHAVITHPDGVIAGAESDSAKTLAGEGSIDRLLTRSSRQDASERIEVYAHAYYSRLIECLGEVFPMLKKFLGEEIFDGFGFAFLQDFPSRSYTLHRLGEPFARYLRDSRPVEESGEATDEWSTLAVELAEFEWAIYEVFDGPGMERKPALRAEEWFELPPGEWEQTRLQTAPCLRVLEMTFPVNRFFTALRAAEDASTVVAPDPERSWVALNRRNFVVRRHELTEPAYRLLGALVDGEALGAAVEAAAAVWDRSDAELASALREWFGEWTECGFFERVERSRAPGA